ncbi:ABC transporter substrate-binding protein [Parasphingorhabdus pacifica]
MLLTAALALSGCSGGTAAEPDADAGDHLSLDNCGEQVQLEHPPQRAVALNQGSAEIMLALGLSDRMVGTATWTDPVLPELAEENAEVPRLAENYPSFERVLAAEPDFAASSFASTLSKGGVATRAQFDELGVPTYLSPADCAKDNSGSGDGARHEPLKMDLVYTEIREIARIFDVAERGEQLVADLQNRMREATADIDASHARLLFWFANSESPYMAGCCGAPGVITRTLDAKNVFDDTKQEWPQINWETVAQRNPDVLVLGDLTRNSETAETARSKIEFLETHPVAREMDAVENDRYVPLTGQAMNPTMRTVDGVEKVAAALREFGLTG